MIITVSTLLSLLQIIMRFERLEYGCAIEYKDFQWLLLFAHYCRYYNL